MHELSIALSIVDAAVEEVMKHGDVRVRAIHLRLGPLSGVVKDALVSAFDMARCDTQVSDAELLIEEVPIRIHCPKCRSDQPIVSIQEFACIQCGTLSADVVQGRELEVVALEIT
jgi:hydrogenase nickel incorporation protein HypA/HybF